MKNRALHLVVTAVFVVVSTLVFVRMHVTGSQERLDDCFETDFAVLIYSNGMHVYMENTAEASELAQECVEIVMSVEPDMGRWQNRTCADPQEPVGISRLLNLYPESEVRFFMAPADDGWFPETAAVLLCGLAGMLFAGSKNNPAKITAGH